MTQQELFRDHLLAPLVAASWVALVMTVLDSVPRSRRFVILTALVVLGIAYVYYSKNASRDLDD